MDAMLVDLGKTIYYLIHNPLVTLWFGFGSGIYITLKIQKENNDATK